LNFLSHDVAKAISFFLGTIVAFIINKYWTFEKHEKSYKEIVQFTILYSLTLGANVITNKFVLIQIDSILFAFLVATGVSTVLNFLGQKFWVFK
jgi:putative flippase GtrA